MNAVRSMEEKKMKKRRKKKEKKRKESEQISGRNHGMKYMVIKGESSRRSDNNGGKNGLNKEDICQDSGFYGKIK